MGRPSSVRRFLLFTFLFSWSAWLLAELLRGQALYLKLFGQNLDFPFYYLFLWAGAFGPGIIALLVSEEKESPSGLWACLTKWRVGPQWYFVAVLLPVGLTILASIAHHMSGGVLVSGWDFQGLFIHALVNLLLSPFWEELGWRGYLLPKLLQAESPMRASITLGIAWGIWHLPLRLGEWGLWDSLLLHFAHTAVFIVNVVGFSVLFTWLFVRSRGALLPVILLHATFNASVNFFVGITSAFDGMGLLLWLTLTVWGTAFLVWRLGGLEPAKDSGMAAVQST